MVTKVLFILLCVFTGSAHATDVSWMYIQHRVYENGRTYNRLAFGLADDTGHELTSDTNVASVKLSDPQGRPVKLFDRKFSRDEEIYGIYDPMRSQWHFVEEWQIDSWFSADFSEPLIPGVYRLKVNTVDGNVAEYEFYFKTAAVLPVITSQSFKLQPDPFGNVIWKWDVPDTLGHMVYNLQTAVKASIDIYKDTEQVAYFFIKLPSHMSYLFIPRNIVQKMRAKGDSFGLRVQLETTDNTTRTYSNTLIINDLTATVSKMKASSSAN
jgi:hypothetical protein